MHRLLLTCLASVALYAAVFAGVADRPLSLGVLRLELLDKTAALAAMPLPRLVILAGSNGPYSHSCAVLGTMLDMPCENAGIAVGIGLDDVFARYAPLLRPGDVVYMPMELAQYTMSAGEYRAAVDGAFLLRHDRDVLREMPRERALGAVFCCQLDDLLESAAEMPLAHLHALDAQALLAREYNEQGDRVDNDLALRDAALIGAAPRVLPTSPEITAGYGSRLISGFVAVQGRRGVVVIGGLPADDRQQALPPDVLAAIRAVYVQNGGAFLALPNESHYPAADFFNSEDHLAKPCQYAHSIALAPLLGAALHRPVQPPSPEVKAMAEACPQ
ncbi:hypothetical protein [Acidocella aromatica]|uniref:Uncharacterized protein n=1 Tax=Acidocella aromatica TaxID=1303579 RepID=A0A840VAR5_9PROT|nr:hypothetical protein [Acidocella aromatica]MBB5372863.1 hypothetical protein [Acidocella aromatica]